MPIELIQVFIRPNIETPWFHDTWPPSHMEYIQTNYKDTGKYTGQRTISEDGLTLIVTHTFTDSDALTEFTEQDEYLAEMKQNRDQYNLANDIISIT